MAKYYKLKMMAKEVKKKDGTGTFTAYRLIKPDGTMVDARFRRGVNAALLPSSGKFWAWAGYVSDASDRYEYPRYYIGDVAKVEPIATETITPDGVEEVTDDLPY